MLPRSQMPEQFPKLVPYLSRVLYEEGPVVKAGGVCASRACCRRAGVKGDGRSPASRRDPRALDAGVAGCGEARIMGRGPQRSCGSWSRSPVSWTEVSSVLYCPGRWPGSGRWECSLRWRNSNRGRHAARTLAAPAGAKGCFVVNMCQMDSAMRRAMSTRAILVPRWRPSRRAVRW